MTRAERAKRTLAAGCRRVRAAGGPSDAERLATLAYYVFESQQPIGRDRARMIVQVLRTLTAHFERAGG